MNLDRRSRDRERVAASIVSVFAQTDEPGYFHRKVSTGTLVRIGNIEFAFTAAHALWDEERGCFLEDAGIYGGARKVEKTIDWYGSVLRGHLPARVVDRYPDPDVCLLEINTDRAELRDERQPYEEAEIGFLHPQSPEQLVLLGGFPGTKTIRSTAPSGVPKFDMTPVIYELASRSDGTHPRCVHARIENELADVRGVSGGPLFVPREGVLVGLLRSFARREGDYELHCEPIAEAVRTLLGHPNGEVARAAEAILARAPG